MTSASNVEFGEFLLDAHARITRATPDSSRSLRRAPQLTHDRQRCCELARSRVSGLTLSNMSSKPWLLALVACLGCNKAPTHTPEPPVQTPVPAKVEPPPAGQAAAPDVDVPLGKLKLPPGFRIGIYASEVEDARSMALSPGGTLYVGTRRAGKLYAIPDANHDGTGDRVVTLASGLDMPNGVVFHDGSLYVAEHVRLVRYDHVEEAVASTHSDELSLPKPALVRGGYPDDDEHGWKYLALGPDGKLYVPVGAPCNMCDPKSPYASLTRVSLDGKSYDVFARGIRNTVGFDWHPRTKELWFSENGRDRLSDDTPGDELNRAPKPGLHFGYPYCHQGSIIDPEFGKPDSCKQAVPPERVLAPHVAALALRFYEGEMFPPEYRGQILIAEHGSWNRSEPIGYRLMRVRLDAQGKPAAYEVFVDGWLQQGKAWGRPVDLLVMPDGALLVSDDEADVIYRITYVG
jgi:glucose/arabinose dehydrogenase